MNWFNAIVAFFSAVATGFAAWAAFLQRDAQFSTALYSKQVDLMAAAENSVGAYAGTVRKIIDIEHQNSDYQTNEQAARNYMQALLALQLVLPKDGRDYIDRLFKVVVSTQNEIHKDQGIDISFKTDARMRQILFNDLSEVMNRSGPLFSCGYNRFSLGHELRAGDVDNCALGKPV